MQPREKFLKEGYDTSSYRINRARKNEIAASDHDYLFEKKYESEAIQSGFMHKYLRQLESDDPKTRKKAQETVQLKLTELCTIYRHYKENREYQERYLAYTDPNIQSAEAQIGLYIEEALRRMFLQSEDPLEMIQSVPYLGNYSKGNRKRFDALVQKKFEAQQVSEEQQTEDNIRTTLAADAAVRQILSSFYNPDNKRQKQLPNALLVPFGRAHIEHLQEKMQYFEERVLKEEFAKAKAYFFQLALQGEIPISYEDVILRLEGVTIHGSDPLEGTLEETLGTYSNQTQIVQVFLLSDPDNPNTRQKYQDTIRHELLHAISGISPILHYYEDRASIEKMSEDERNEELISIATHNSGNKFDRQFNWLNEAITETLSHIRTDVGNTTPPKERSYQQERRVFEHLASLGLDITRAYEMYFEDWGDTDNLGTETHALPKTKGFFEDTNAVFGTGFMIRLNKYIAVQSPDNSSSRITKHTADKICSTTSVVDLQRLIRVKVKDTDAGQKII